MKTLLFRRNRALTLSEVMVLLAGFAILAALMLSGLGRCRPGPIASQINCVSNLKQIGLGWLTWAHDNETSDLPFRVPVAKGGSMGSAAPYRNSAWWQYSIISNYISSPKSFVCPADKNVGTARRPATTWSITDSSGGFIALGFRDRAISYTLHLDPGQLLSDPQQADVILDTDRNIRFDGRDSLCSAGVGEAEVIRVKGKNGQNPPASAAWTNAIHYERGNVLSVDGAVQQTRPRDLDQMCDLSDDNGRIHFLVPK